MLFSSDGASTNAQPCGQKKKHAQGTNVSSYGAGYISLNANAKMRAERRPLHQALAAVPLHAPLFPHPAAD